MTCPVILSVAKDLGIEEVSGVPSAGFFTAFKMANDIMLRKHSLRLIRYQFAVFDTMGRNVPEAFAFVLLVFAVSSLEEYHL